MKRILLTAAHSYIGCAFKEYVSAHWDAYEVDMISQRGENWRQTDFSVYDAVVDVTGIAHVDNGKMSAGEAAAYEKVNCTLAVETARRAKAAGVSQFIYLSSMIVYGGSGAIGRPHKILKDTEPTPEGSYGASKLHAEQGLFALQDDYFTVAAVRSPMVYGPGCKGNYPRLAKLARISPVFPKIGNCRSMIYIDHLCELLRLMIDGGDGGIFTPQDKEWVNTAELVRQISHVHRLPMLLIPGFEKPLCFLAKKMPMLNKIFGSYAYEMGMSDYYGGTYQMYSLAEAVALTEGRPLAHKKRKKRSRRSRYLRIKRYADCVLCLIGLLFALPLFAGICAAVKLDSPGPVFFKQKRVGYGKKTFDIYKFRTMYIDTPKDMPTHLLKDPEQYITKVGKFLRKTSLDELPQIFNILMGDMSLVGPRPALWNQYDLIAERDKYHANQLPPGLTGWAQIHGRDELEIPKKAALDGYYAKHFGPAMDVRCLIGTVGAVLTHRGVREGGTKGC